MKTKSGEEMLNVFRYKHSFGVFIAAQTKEIAANLVCCDKGDLSRVKGFYATGTPRELR